MFNFICVANLIARKNIDSIVFAFNEVQKFYPEIRLTIIGDGAEHLKLNALSKELGLNEKICFTDALTRNQIADFLAKSDCFVLASQNETFGVVYIEAMAFGLPVIASICGGPEGFITEDVGLLVR